MTSSSQPLLHDSPSSSTAYDDHAPRYLILYRTSKNGIREFLSSRAQHYVVLGLVSCDLLGIFADIIINLYQCDGEKTEPIWNDVRDGLGIAGLVFSCLFMVELILCVWAFGLRSVGFFIQEASSNGAPTLIYPIKFCWNGPF